MKMLEILHSTNFSNLMASQTVQTVFHGFNPDLFIRTDEKGCTLYDIKDIYHHLTRKINLEKEKVTNASPSKEIKSNQTKPNPIKLVNITERNPANPRLSQNSRKYGAGP